MDMKKLLVVLVLLACITAVAFASFSNNRKKAGVENKIEKKKKECKRSCLFS